MNSINKIKKVFIAMSGGVDSSVASLLLKRKGYEVIGVFMRCFNLDGCAEKDAEDARRVAEKLKIPFYVWDFEEEYKKKVVDYMVSGYRNGITPNPDVMCNREIKFGLFLKKALAMGANYVATGHYVKLATSKRRQVNNRYMSHVAINYLINQAKDKNKDQSYFLWTLTQEQLKYCLFPIGNYLKSEVRKIAAKAGLPTAVKKDSQGICFLGKVKLSDFLGRYIPEKQGSVLSLTGEKIGEHKGSYFYTIGQRHGLALSARHPASGSKETKPFYVADKNVKQNTIIVVDGEDSQALYKQEVELNNVSFVNLEYSTILKNAGISGLKVLARVRYRQPLASAKFYKLQATSYKLVFDKSVKFVASGQSAVFYSKKGEMLGGGVIK